MFHLASPFTIYTRYSSVLFWVSNLTGCIIFNFTLQSTFRHIMKQIQLSNLVIYLVFIVYYFFTRENFLSKLIETTILFSVIAVFVFMFGKWREQKSTELSWEPASHKFFSSCPSQPTSLCRTTFGTPGSWTYILTFAHSFLPPIQTINAPTI